MEEFNKSLVQQNKILTILEYVSEVNKLFYNIDISFMEDFINLVNKDICCIHMDLLQKYNIITIDNSGKLLRLLERNDFEISKDYVREEDNNKITYYLHPNTFKKLLIRSYNTDKYADYYLLLEICFKNYNDYQIQMLRNENSIIITRTIQQIENADISIEWIILFERPTYEYNYCVLKGIDRYTKNNITKVRKGNNCGDVIFRMSVNHPANFWNKVIENNLIEHEYKTTRHCNKRLTRNFKLCNIDITEFIIILKSYNVK